MNVQALLNQIILLVPQFQQAVGGFTRALPPLIQSLGVFALAVQTFVAAQGGWQAILQRLAQSRVGQAVGGAIGSFAASAASAVASAAGTVMSAAAAALASPFGEVVIAAVAVGAALTALGVITERVFRAMLESQRHLAESSGAMAAVFAQTDVNRTLREMRAGNEQAGTAGFLAGRLDSLADTLQPIMTLLANIANVIGGIMVFIVDVVVTPISFIVEAINSFFAWIKDHWPWGGGADDEGPQILSQWLDKVAEDARRDRAAVRPFGGMAFP